MLLDSGLVELDLGDRLVIGVLCSVGTVLRDIVLLLEGYRAVV